MGKAKVVPLKKQQPLWSNIECSVHTSHHPQWSANIRLPFNKQADRKTPTEQAIGSKGNLFECVEKDV